MVRFFLPTVALALFSLAVPPSLVADEQACDTMCDELGCDGLALPPAKKTKARRNRTPVMIGDFYSGSRLGLRGDATIDRLLVLADDLDAPLVLPPIGNTLTLTEPGPVGVFSTSLLSIQQLQTLLINADPIPGATLMGTVTDDATLTTTLTIGQIQTLLAGTGTGFDIIPIQAPPGTYTTAVDAIFAANNGLPGTTTFNAAGSGALLQGGVDTLNGGEDLDAYYFYDYVIRFDTAIADASSGGVGRMKIAEGGSVLPQDRVFFRYSYLDQVRYSQAGAGLSRYVPGFEKSFLDGMVSLEMRAPFVSNTATATTIDGDAIGNGSDTAFGNLTLYPKVMLHNGQRLAVSGGVGIVLPTADDITARFADGTPLMNISNDAVRLQPFLGGMFTPSDRLFVHGFLQCDVETAGNAVRLNAGGTGLQHAGTITDGTNLFVDAGVGYWLYKSQSTHGVTGIIPTIEIHQNIALGGSDVVNAGPFTVGNFTGGSSLTNVVAGSTIEFNQRSHLTAAYVGPIGGGSARAFDGGVQLMFNHFFGP